MSSQKYSIIAYFLCSLFILLILSTPYTSIILVDAVKHTKNKSQPESLQAAETPNDIDTGQRTNIQQEVTSNNPSSSTDHSSTSNLDSVNDPIRGNSKVAILTFDDGYKSQFTVAKSILDKYDFKATFFVVCNYVEKDANGRMDWKDVTQLHDEGHDIEAHTMNHKDLTTLSLDEVDYELGQSKQCLLNHGIDSKIFSYPFSKGSDNIDIVNTVAKYYSMARINDFPLMFLRCDGFENHQQQNDCRTFTDDGKLTFANRYSIKSWAHQHLQDGLIYDDTQMFQKFVEVVNSQNNYNKEGTINAVPIITYHNITFQSSDYENQPYDTNADLFDEEMRYLHDNNFKVITMSDLGYNGNSNSFYITH
jgi:peptidoglycan/xylan/chitin deacetylase (PgdA/CDA1 family)